MKLPMNALIGFSAYVLCASFCPVNMNVMAMDMDMSGHDHVAMEDHHDAGHDVETSECENCDNETLDDVAFTILSPDSTDTVTTLEASVALQLYSPSHFIVIPRYHLAVASPQIAPDIVSTIVLRT